MTTVSTLRHYRRKTPLKIPLKLAPGVVGDNTEFDTGGWRASDGIRFWRGLPQTVGGWESLSLTLLTGVCRSAFCWTDAESLLTIVYGLHNGLTAWQAGEQGSITPSAFVPGQIDGTGGAGYGTGAYGVGDYGEPSATDYFPLTWTFGARSFGELYANPRGQGIFTWANVVANIATPLTGAPAVCNSIDVAWTDQVMAFGCTDTGGLFNASCIRISDISDPTEWTISTASTAQQFYLKGGGRIVRSLAVGRYRFVWTDSELHLGTYASGWDFEPLGAGGLCGPNAAVVKGQTAYWIGPDLQFYSCSLGGAPQILDCPIRDAFVDNAAPSQNDKIVCSSVSEWGEVVWYYADARDGSGYEISRSVRLSTIDGSWSMGTTPRTAFIDANPAPNPIGVTFDGQTFWHERGNSANGAVMSASLTTGGQYIDPAERVMLLRGAWPDFKDQVGPINLTVRSRMFPQDTPVEHGPFLLAPDTNKSDFLVTGRIFEFEFASNSSPMGWRLGKPTFDVVAAGEH